MRIMKYFITFAPEMANSFFQFKQFRVSQDRCAMKVGTDGTLLGAWAQGGTDILDIGTGTGLIALMMAQRFPESTIKAIDIDAEACSQAAENVAASPFAQRMVVVHASLQSYTSTCDSIVCNPPFFSDSLHSPDSQRTMARHTTTLSYAELFRSVAGLLSQNGVFSAVIPFDCRRAFDDEAIFAGLFPSRVCAVRTTWRKPPRRYLLEYRRNPVAVETSELVIGSEEHQHLLRDFLL